MKLNTVIIVVSILFLLSSINVLASLNAAPPPPPTVLLAINENTSQCGYVSLYFDYETNFEKLLNDSNAHPGWELQRGYEFIKYFYNTSYGTCSINLDTQTPMDCCTQLGLDTMQSVSYTSEPILTNQQCSVSKMGELNAQYYEGDIEKDCTKDGNMYTCQEQCDNSTKEFYCKPVKERVDILIDTDNNTCTQAIRFVLKSEDGITIKDNTGHCQITSQTTQRIDYLSYDNYINTSLGECQFESCCNDLGLELVNKSYITSFNQSYRNSLDNTNYFENHYLDERNIFQKISDFFSNILFQIFKI